MAKYLLLVRHAKSDWNNFNLSDFNRPLNDRGLRNAPEMAKRLKKKNLIPDKLISSPAVRALTTAEHFADVFGYERSNISEIKEIYEAHTSTLLDVINRLDDTHHFVALFGHNPGMTNLAVKLTDSDIDTIPTCGIVLIEFPYDNWSMVSSGTGHLKLYDFPKNRKGSYDEM